MKRHGFIATALVALSLAVMALPVAAMAESADVDESFALYAASSSCPGNNGGKHSLKVATKEATCTEAGEKYIYCTLCDTVHETLSTTPALDHDFSVAVNEVPATCTTDGSTGGWKCTRCGETADHNFQDGKCVDCGYQKPSSGGGTSGSNHSSSSDGLDSVPKTGDVTPIFAYGVLMLLGAAAIVIRRIRLAK